MISVNVAKSRLSPPCSRPTRPIRLSVMACEGLVLLKKPQIPLKEWILTHHQVTRVYFVPPGESREVLAGLLAVSVLISMCIMFSMWSTNPICRLQDTCQEGCRATGACPSGTSPYNFTTNIWMKPTTQNSDWDRCLKTAINWRAHPGNVRVKSTSVG